MISSSSVVAAVREGGVCRGTLWLEVKVAGMKKKPPTENHFCVLAGASMDAYESVLCYSKGDLPVLSLAIVGASALQPTSSSARSIILSQTTSSNSTAAASFKLMTDQGTHVNCQAPSADSRNVWLAALHAGLELSLLSLSPRPPVLPPPSPQTPVKQTARKSKKYCLSCGTVESAKKPVQSSTPLLQFGKEQSQPVCWDCWTAQGLVQHLEWYEVCLASFHDEQEAIDQARTLVRSVTGAGRMVSETDVAAHAAAQQSAVEAATIASEEGLSSRWGSNDEEDTEVDATPDSPVSSEASSSSALSSPVSSSQPWIHLPPNQASSKALLAAVQDVNQFGPLARRSLVLEGLAHDLTAGTIGVADFLLQLDEAAGIADSGLAAIKRQAWTAAGDMGSALGILQKAVTGSEDNLHVLRSLLEFLLDLCRHDEMASLAFYWPQICHLHLRMLPPTTTLAVARVELMEDFLITVATQYSVHLALQLVWSHTADLEDSLQPPTAAAATVCPSKCKSRRHAVLRFICELESCLFDFEGGWGGGSVSLGKLLAPAGHQVEAMRATMGRIQEWRKKGRGSSLSQSARRDVWTDRYVNKPAEAAVTEKLRIAKNADYFSCHLNFTKRICDIAEKLRFMDISKRPAALEAELNLLNSSGTMGGDPLNRVRDDHLIRIVRVPANEGHVFRSKERTPVLLLMEVVDEGADVELLPADDSVSPKHRKRETASGQATGETTVPGGSTTEVASTAIDPIEVTDNEDSVDGEEETQGEAGDVSLEAPQTPTRAAAGRPVLEGASGGELRSPGALKRFDSMGERDFGETATDDVHQNVKETLADLVMPDISVKEQSTKEDEEDEAVTVESSDTVATESGASESKEDEMTTKNGGDGKKKMSTLGVYPTSSDSDTNTFSPTGDIRREVLNAIMMTGSQGNVIAAGAVQSVQRILQALEHKRATELLRDEDDLTEPDDALGIANKLGLEHREGSKSEEDETMEAIRLLLVQNRVAQGHLSPSDAAKVLQHTSLSRTNSFGKLSKNANGDVTIDPSEVATVDAGDIDPRLVGCGPVPPAVLQALTLWKGGMVTHAELLELVKKDIEFVKHSVLLDAENVNKLQEDSAFWGRFAFGERWAEKKARIGSSSPQGSMSGWDLVGVIVKSNDDLRQEAFIMQLIQLCQEAFDLAGLELWVSPYQILATGRTTGIIEMVRNAMSFDALKKRPGYGKGGLKEHLLRMTEYAADPAEALKSAQINFVRSLAAYSLMSHFFLFKDRHNGNILMDTAGHVIHIDFGFVFGSAPGGSFSLELSTPFKITDEILDVMGGPKSPLFSEFVTLFCCGFLALQAHCDTFLTLLDITCKDSTFKCFEGRDSKEIVSKIRERFCPELTRDETVAFALDLIKQSISSYGTRQYDMFQYLSNGIAA